MTSVSPAHNRSDLHGTKMPSFQTLRVVLFFIGSYDFTIQLRFYVSPCSFIRDKYLNMEIDVKTWKGSYLH